MTHVTGIHHAALRCKDKEQYAAVLKFYGEVLELPIKRSSEGSTMFDTGAGLIEIFDKGGSDVGEGVWRHIALAVDDVDAVVSAAKAAGLANPMEPRDIILAGDPPQPARIAFIEGVLGESIELFNEK